MDRTALRNFTHNAGNFLNTSNTTYRQWVFRYTFLELEKDLGLYGDVTTNLVFSDRSLKTFKVVARSNGILAGRKEVEYFLSDSNANFKPRLLSGIGVEFFISDGEGFAKGDVLAEITGDVRDLLAVERVVLNLLNRMSNVATFTAEVVDLVKEEDVLICPTRKTLWGLLDKKAVLLGGGGTHRLNLSDSIIVKDTHLNSTDMSFSDLIEEAEKVMPDVRFLEIEVSTTTDAVEVAKLFCESKLQTIGVVMLDNMSPMKISETLSEVKGAGYYDSVLFEASGGINKENVLEYAKSGVDIISMGCLTSGVSGVDLAMEG